MEQCLNFDLCSQLKLKQASKQASKQTNKETNKAVFTSTEIWGLP
jgi:hypothetical protein